MSIKGYDSGFDVEMYSSEALPSTATFTAQIRAFVESSAIVATITTQAGHITFLSSTANPASTEGREFINKIRVDFPASMTADWVGNTFYTDFVRTDVTPFEHLGFIAKLEFETPVTRL